VEDYDLWCRLALAGVRFANLSEPLVRYRIHAGGSKRAKLRGILRGTLDIKMRYWNEHMDLAARARLWAERCLLLLPPEWVLRLFMRLQYTARLPSGPG
jgi:hypothetical protein